jgi:hypothetical protein
LDLAFPERNHTERFCRKGNWQGSFEQKVIINFLNRESEEKVEEIADLLIVAGGAVSELSLDIYKIKNYDKFELGIIQWFILSRIYLKGWFQLIVGEGYHSRL